MRKTTKALIHYIELQLEGFILCTQLTYIPPTSITLDLRTQPADQLHTLQLGLFFDKTLYYSLIDTKT